VICHEQALGLFVERDVRRIRPRQRIVAGVFRNLGRRALFRLLGPIRVEHRNLVRARKRNVEVARFSKCDSIRAGTGIGEVVGVDASSPPAAPLA
jgi:hypothetical protein